MRIDEFWKVLSTYGVDVPLDVQHKVGTNLNQERVMIRPPASSHKRAVLEYGTTVPATFIARNLGITVRQVRKIRQLVRG